MLKFSHMQFKRPQFDIALDLETSSNRIVIMGASGSGKSTILSLIAGHEIPSHGHIIWQGQHTTGQCSFLFQKNNLFPHLTLLQNVGLALKHSLKLPPQCMDQALCALEEMEIRHLATCYPHEVSGGEQQRAALARTMLMDKPLLLLDEPFNGLGPGLSEQIMDKIHHLETLKNICTIFTTHSPFEAQYFGGEVLFLDQGKITERGEWEQLTASQNPNLCRYFGQSFAFAS